MNNRQQQILTCMTIGALFGAIVLFIASRMGKREQYEEVGPTSQSGEIELEEEGVVTGDAMGLSDVTPESLMAGYLEHVHSHTHDADGSIGTSGEAVGTRLKSTRMSGINSTQYDALGDVGIEGSTGGVDEGEEDNVGAEAERIANEKALKENVARKAIDADEKAKFAQKAVEDARTAREAAREAAADAIRVIGSDSVM